MKKVILITTVLVITFTSCTKDSPLGKSQGSTAQKKFNTVKVRQMPEKAPKK